MPFRAVRLAHPGFAIAMPLSEVPSSSRCIRLQINPSLDAVATACVRVTAPSFSMAALR